MTLVANVLTNAGSVDNGTHLYLVAFWNGTVETLSGPSVPVVITDSSTAGQVSLTNIPTGPFGTLERRIYRTKSGVSFPYHLLCTITNNTSTDLPNAVSLNQINPVGFNVDSTPDVNLAPAPIIDIRAVPTFIGKKLIRDIIGGFLKFVPVSSTAIGFFRIGTGGFVAQPGGVLIPKEPDSGRLSTGVATGYSLRVNLEADVDPSLFSFQKNITLGDVTLLNAITNGVGGPALLQFSNLSTTVTAPYGARFVAEVTAGDSIRAPDGSFVTVLSIQNNTQLTLTAPYTGPTGITPGPTSFLIDVKCLLDFVEANNIPPHEFFEIGLFVPYPSALNPTMIAYGTFPGESKTVAIQLFHHVRLGF